MTLVSVALPGCTASGPEPFTRAAVIDRLDGGVGGPKAIARDGDILLENDQVRVAILSSRVSMGPGLYGGSIVDADLQWNDPRFPPGYGNDQLAESFTTVNMNIIHTDPADGEDVEIVSEGGPDSPAIVRVSGKGEPFITLLGALWAIVNAPDVGIVTEYEVNPGEPWVTIRTIVTVPWDGTSPLALTGTPLLGSDDGLPILEWAVEDGVALGDFYLQGGSVDVFAPGMGFDEDGEVYQAGLEGHNTVIDPFQFAYVAGVGNGISYGMAPTTGDAYVPLFTSSQTAIFGAGQLGDGSGDRFPAGSSFTYERRFYIGHGDVGSIFDAYLLSRDLPRGHVHGSVLQEITAAPRSRVNVFAYRVVDGVTEERPYVQWLTDVDPRDDVADGSFEGDLPPGDYELVAHIPGITGADPIQVHIDEGDDVGVALELPRPGVANITIRDEFGRPVPAKITLFRDDAPQTRDPILGDGFVGGDPQLVFFANYGQASLELPPGEYHAVASRGIEYELGVSESFRIDDATNQQIILTVMRSVDTEGWIAADLHVHAQPSHDSGVTLDQRVSTMVCEGIEFFSSTDHDYVTDYAPVVEDMGLEEWVQTAIGNEVTTIEIGHFLGFPLDIDFLADGRGAMDWTGKKPTEIVAGIRAAGSNSGYDPAVFVGHPRDGILGYFDQYGMNPYGGTPGMTGMQGVPLIDRPILSRTNDLLDPAFMDWTFDGLELLNGKRFELIRTPTQAELDAFAETGDVPIYDMIARTMQEQQELEDGVYRLGYGHEGQIDDWFTLLNLGFTFTALGNSDTHGLTHVESGCPRNFVVSDTDDPAFIDDQAIADAVKAHKVVPSYGPFVRFSLDDATVGDTLHPGGSTVVAHVSVQAPTWITVDRVNLYENGTLVHEWLPTETGDVLRLDETLEITPTKDSWYVIEVVGDDDLAPVFTPLEMPEIQLQTVVTEALSNVDAIQSYLSPAVPIPTTYPVVPYAITNPIWVDLAGDGFTPPGLPDWLLPPVERAE